MPPSIRWHSATRALHWASSLLVVLCVGAVLTKGLFPKNGTASHILMHDHMALGLSIGALAVARLLVRARHPAPNHNLPSGLRIAALAAQAALYALMLFLPLAGYLAASGRGVPITLVLGWALPPLPVTASLAHAALELHRAAAWGLIGLALLHAAAGLYHHVVRKDDVLRSMLWPSRSAPE